MLETQGSSSSSAQYCWACCCCFRQCLKTSYKNTCIQPLQRLWAGGDLVSLGRATCCGRDRSSSLPQHLPSDLARLLLTNLFSPKSCGFEIIPSFPQGHTHTPLASGLETPPLFEESPCFFSVQLWWLIELRAECSLSE